MVRGRRRRRWVQMMRTKCAWITAGEEAGEHQFELVNASSCLLRCDGWGITIKLANGGCRERLWKVHDGWWIEIDHLNDGNSSGRATAGCWLGCLRRLPHRQLTQFSFGSLGLLLVYCRRLNNQLARGGERTVFWFCSSIHFVPSSTLSSPSLVGPVDGVLKGSTDRETDRHSVESRPIELPTKRPTTHVCTLIRYTQRRGTHGRPNRERRAKVREEETRWDERGDRIQAGRLQRKFQWFKNSDCKCRHRVLLFSSVGHSETEQRQGVILFKASSQEWTREGAMNWNRNGKLLF